jgi:hypothetical protein
MTRTQYIRILYKNNDDNYEVVFTNNHIHTEDVLINNHTCYSVNISGLLLLENTNIKGELNQKKLASEAHFSANSKQYTKRR